jgi:DNA-binding LacI/PurR family transcriptional regulator
MVLDEQPCPTAVFVGSDLQVLGILVPAQLSVVGYNDVVLAGCAGVTTIRIPWEDIGRHTATVLQDHTEGGLGRHPTRLRFVGELIEQRTTGRRDQPVVPSGERSGG